jgi:hypothetical protein
MAELFRDELCEIIEHVVVDHRFIPSIDSSLISVAGQTNSLALRYSQNNACLETAVTSLKSSLEDSVHLPILAP